MRYFFKSLINWWVSQQPVPALYAGPKRRLKWLQMFEPKDSPPEKRRLTNNTVAASRARSTDNNFNFFQNVSSNKWKTKKLDQQ